jgi:hypothetical protein
MPDDKLSERRQRLTPAQRKFLMENRDKELIAVKDKNGRILRFLFEEPNITNRPVRGRQERLDVNTTRKRRMRGRQERKGSTIKGTIDQEVINRTIDAALGVANPSSAPPIRAPRATREEQSANDLKAIEDRREQERQLKNE